MDIATNPDQSSKDSFLLRMDPRVKIFCSLSMVAAVILTPPEQIYKFIGYFIILCFFLAVSKVMLKDVGRKLILIGSFIAFLALFLFLFGQESPSEKMNALWNLSVKSVLCFLSLILLNVATRFYDFIKGLEVLNIPPVITGLLSFAYRYGILFRKEVKGSLIAKRARSLGSRKIWNEIITAGHLVSHAVLRSFARSETIYAAMLSRGFDGKVKTLKQFRLKKGDYIIMSICPLILIGVAVLI